MSGLHFSDLKHFAVSAAHFKYALDNPKPMTAAMRLGMMVDRMLTGGRVPPMYLGSPDGNMKRQGTAWKDYVKRCAEDGWRAEEIATEPESDEACAIVRAVQQDDLAMQYLTGRPQVELEWETMGVKRVTRGLDVVGPNWFTDLKVTACAKPDRLMRHATDMLWHAQLADYREAARQNGLDVTGGVFLVAIESKPPYVATVLEMSEEMLGEGEKCIHLWLEKYKACVAADAWPGYSQCPVRWEPWQPRGVELTGLEEEAGDG